jgi:hypothetical protein
MPTCDRIIEFKEIYETKDPTVLVRYKRVHSE